ncbi:hypothetical protein HNS38_10370 [Lentimicrobium sp. L6]|uniref:hypothetical protein n=1 Tax=Lentimicrobium sp. L6 TaxID=2735916 RepID=UPI0015559386|nr:hypothetical protein [Lentimicrobium sp. L6]NPD85166.1 hypothetical protein [Lentimicrobium sp. L6]
MKKYIGIALLVIGIIGFFYSANQKNEKEIFSKRASSSNIEKMDVAVLANQTYEIKFWGVDEEMTGTYEPPHFEADIKILDRQKLVLFDEELVSITEREIGEKRVTHDGTSYSHSPTVDETIEIQVQIKRGDYIDIEIYENLSSEADALPGFSIILALIGLVLYLRGRKKA